MRYKKIEMSPANKRQYLLAVSLRDIELLIGEAENASKHMPVTKDTKYDRRRLGSINKALKEAYAAAKKDQDDGARIPVAERDKYSENTPDNPLHTITRLEIIDKVKGREVIFWDKNKKVTPSIQDGNRTLKLFIDDRSKDEMLIDNKPDMPPLFSASDIEEILSSFMFNKNKGE